MVLGLFWARAVQSWWWRAEPEAGKEGAPEAAVFASLCCPWPPRLRFLPSTSQPELCFLDTLVATGPHACEGNVCVCTGGERARWAGALPPRTRLAVCPQAALGGKAGGRQRGCKLPALITASLLPAGLIYIRATRQNFYNPPLPPPVARAQARNKRPRTQTPVPRLRLARARKQAQGYKQPSAEKILAPSLLRLHP